MTELFIYFSIAFTCATSVFGIGVLGCMLINRLERWSERRMNRQLDRLRKKAEAGDG